MNLIKFTRALVGEKKQHEQISSPTVRDTNVNTIICIAFQSKMSLFFFKKRKIYLSTPTSSKKNPFPKKKQQRNLYLPLRYAATTDHLRMPTFWIASLKVSSSSWDQGIFAVLVPLFPDCGKKSRMYICSFLFFSKTNLLDADIIPFFSAPFLQGGMNQEQKKTHTKLKKFSTHADKD